MTLVIGFTGVTSYAKEYIVGTNAEYPPFEYIENGKITGFDYELMEEVAKRADIQIKWLDTTFDGLVPALNTRRVDIVIAGMTDTPQRKKAVDFSTPYLVSPITFLTNEVNGIPSMQELEGKKYGVQLGTTQEEAANGIKGAKVVSYGSPAIAILDLKANKLDGVLVDRSVAHNYVANNSGIKILGELEGDSKAIAVTKGDKVLLEKINKALESAQNDGFIDNLRAKYKL
jgi:polar amino acid transport system substrate-binding protein